MCRFEVFTYAGGRFADNLQHLEDGVLVQITPREFLMGEFRCESYGFARSHQHVEQVGVVTPHRRPWRSQVLPSAG